MTHMITIDLLGKLDACRAGLNYFTREHGEDATLEEVLSNPRLDPRHAGWLGRMLPAEYLSWEERLALQCDDYDRARFGRHCPAGVKGATWEARLTVQYSNEERAALAYHCPTGVEGATWEARLALRFNSSDQAWLGRHCPAGVEGATLEARLAVQLNELGRDYVLKKFGGGS